MIKNSQVCITMSGYRVEGLGFWLSPNLVLQCVFLKSQAFADRELGASGIRESHVAAKMKRGWLRVLSMGSLVGRPGHVCGGCKFLQLKKSLGPVII